MRPANASALVTRLDDLHQRGALAVQHRRPTRLRHDIGKRQPGLLGQLAHDAALEIDSISNEIIPIGRAGRK